MTGWSRAFRQLFRRPAFLLVTGLLLAGAIGLDASTRYLRLHFRKQAMPLRPAEGLAAIPATLGTWVSAPETRTIDSEMVHSLGTDKYNFREYINTAARISAERPLATKADVLSLGDKTSKDRFTAVETWRASKPDAVVNFAITYYTGKVDTVPHVPDRCYVADGFQPSSYKAQVWKLGKYRDGSDREVTVRFIEFEDQTSRGALNRCVAYFFHANGSYEDDPKQVRVRLQDLRERCAYFAKIEVMTVLPPRPGATENDPFREADRQAAAAAMQSFLTAALPEIEKVLPDWANRPR